MTYLYLWYFKYLKYFLKLMVQIYDTQYVLKTNKKNNKEP